MSNVKFSIVIPTLNKIHLTTACFDSILNNLPSSKNLPIEIIFVDNGSTDGAVDWIKSIIDNWETRLPPGVGVKTVCNSKNLGFSAACNQGFAQAEGEFLVFLNNDTLVSHLWLDDVVAAFEAHGEIGLAGPVSNFAGGMQGIKVQYDQHGGRENFAKWVRTNYNMKAINVGQIVGLCVFAKRTFLDTLVGFHVPEGQLWDESFFPGMWEDNDLCFRAALKQGRVFILPGIYLHHEGSQTFKDLGDKDDSKKIYMDNQAIYLKKWREITNKPSKEQKICAMLRVKDGEKHIERCLVGLEKWVDEIVILDTGSTDETIPIIAEHIGEGKKVVLLDIDTFKEEPLKEDVERQRLLEMAQSRDPDWIVRVDVDEVWEDEIVEWRERLVNPYDPTVLCWRFPMKTFWRGEDKYRVDGSWGQMAPFAMFRNLPGQVLNGSDHPQGFHCSATPEVPPTYMGIAPIAMLHYGYCDWDEVVRKKTWYSAVDTDKRIENIGTPDYDHLIDETSLSLMKYYGFRPLTLAMVVSDEYIIAKEAIESLHWLLSEIVITYTGEGEFDPDGVLAGFKDILRVVRYPWDDNYSNPRNVGLDTIKSGWIIHLDPDERLQAESAERLYSICQENVDVFTVTIINYLIDSDTGNRKQSRQTAPRLFMANPLLRYENPIHETLDNAILKIRDSLIIKEAIVTIDHLGFLQDNLDEKLAKYKVLNEKWLKDAPNDPRPYYNLGMQCLDDGEVAKGIGLMEKAIALNNIRLWQAPANLAGVYIRMGRELLGLAAKQLPKGHINREEFEKTIKYLDMKVTSFVRVGSKKNDNDNESGATDVARKEDI